MDDNLYFHKITLPNYNACIQRCSHIRSKTIERAFKQFGYLCNQTNISNTSESKRNCTPISSLMLLRLHEIWTGDLNRHKKKKQAFIIKIVRYLICRVRSSYQALAVFQQRTGVIRTSLFRLVTPLTGTFATELAMCIQKTVQVKHKFLRDPAV